MFTVTPDQGYILSILNATKVMRNGQAARLIGKLYGGDMEKYTQGCLAQLRHIRKLTWKTQDVFTLPLLFHAPVDEDMLSAADVMLDLTNKRVLSVSAGPAPYKLRFLSEQGEGVKGFAVITVKPGSEREITDLLYGAPDSHIAIFLLEEYAQKDSIKTTLPHYFAVLDCGRRRYFGRGR